jgi:hypothetical protein
VNSDSHRAMLTEYGTRDEPCVPLKCVLIFTRACPEFMDSNYDAGGDSDSSWRCSLTHVSCCHPVSSEHHEVVTHVFEIDLVLCAIVSMHTLIGWTCQFYDVVKHGVLSTLRMPCLSGDVHDSCLTVMLNQAVALALIMVLRVLGRSRNSSSNSSSSGSSRK